MKIKLGKNSIVALFSTLIIGGLLFLIIPQYSKIKSATITLEEKKAELEYTLLKNSDEGWVSTKSENLTSKINELNAHGIKKIEALEFITSLEDEATEANLSGLQLQIPEFKEGSGLETLPIQITANGSWQQVLSYIINLEQSDYLFDIDEIQLTRAAVERDEPASFIKLQIMAKTYWR
ncbi:MAG: hypothetical protein ABIB97_01000 [Patescibacteria group bacterium]